MPQESPKKQRPRGCLGQGSGVQGQLVFAPHMYVSMRHVQACNCFVNHLRLCVSVAVRRYHGCMCVCFFGSTLRCNLGGMCLCGRMSVHRHRGDVLSYAIPICHPHTLRHAYKNCAMRWIKNNLHTYNHSYHARPH